MREPRKWLIVLMALGTMSAACATGGGTTTIGGTTAATTGGTTATTGAPTATTAAGIAVDVGVDDTTIRLGMLADLTGIFAPLVTDIVTAQEVYWQQVNDAGGIAGRTIELLIEDTGYDVPTHQTKYEALRTEVVALTQSTGSPHTASIIPLIEEDNMAVIPLSWYSGWADPAIGSNALEQQTNYCLESMNVMSWLTEKHQADTGELPTVAILSFPGEYGQDGATGAKIAATALGLEVVYDGEGVVNPAPDVTDRSAEIAEIVRTQPDWVFTTINPTSLGQIMGGAGVSGYTGQWTGSVPSYSFRLLDSEVAPLIDAAYWQSAYNVAWGTDVEGMAELVAAMTETNPDKRPSDAFIFGWLEAKTMEQILRLAADNGDMTREGVLNAALSIPEIDFGGLAPTQTYAGEPNDYVVRASAMFKPRLQLYTDAGGAEQTIGTAPNGGTTGSELIADFFVSDLAAEYDFQAACFTSG